MVEVATKPKPPLWLDADVLQLEKLPSPWWVFASPPSLSKLRPARAVDAPPAGECRQRRRLCLAGAGCSSPAAPTPRRRGCRPPAPEPTHRPAPDHEDRHRHPGFCHRRRSRRPGLPLAALRFARYASASCCPPPVTTSSAEQLQFATAPPSTGGSGGRHAGDGFVRHMRTSRHRRDSHRRDRPAAEVTPIVSGQPLPDQRFDITPPCASCGICSRGIEARLAQLVVEAFTLVGTFLPELKLFCSRSGARFVPIRTFLFPDQGWNLSGPGALCSRPGAESSDRMLAPDREQPPQIGSKAPT